MKLLLFDIDGTLLLTGGAGKVAFEKVFEELFSVPGVWRDIVPDGKTDPIIIDELIAKNLPGGITAAQYEQLCRKYEDYFESEIDHSPRFRLMPGVPDLLKALSDEKDLLLGVATGNFEKPARLKLKRGGLDGFFPFGGYGSDSRVRLELTAKAIERAQRHAGKSFARHEIYVIGDTIHDIRAGHQLEARTIALATGSTPQETLARENPAFLWERLPDPAVFLEKIRAD